MYASRLLVAVVAALVACAPALATPSQKGRSGIALPPRIRPGLSSTESVVVDALVFAAQAEGWQMLHMGRFVPRAELETRYPWVERHLTDVEKEYAFTFTASASSYRVDAVPRVYDARNTRRSFTVSEEQIVRGDDHEGAKARSDDRAVAVLIDDGERVTTDDYWRRRLASEELQVRAVIDEAEDRYRERFGRHGTLAELEAAGLLSATFVHEGYYEIDILNPSAGGYAYGVEVRAGLSGRPLPARRLPELDPTKIPEPERLSTEASARPADAPRSVDERTAVVVRSMIRTAQFVRGGKRIGDGYLSLREMGQLLDLALGGHRPEETSPRTFGQGLVPEADRSVSTANGSYRLRFEIAADRSAFRMWATPERYGETGRLSLYVENEGPLRGADLRGADAGPSAPPLVDSEVWLSRAEDVDMAEAAARFDDQERREAELERSVELGVPTFTMASPVEVEGMKRVQPHSRFELTITTRVRTAATYDFAVELESGSASVVRKTIPVALAPGDDHVTLTFDSTDQQRGRAFWATGDLLEVKVRVTRKMIGREYFGTDNDSVVDADVTQKSFDLDGVYTFTVYDRE